MKIRSERVISRRINKMGGGGGGGGGGRGRSHILVRQDKTKQKQNKIIQNYLTYDTSACSAWVLTILPRLPVAVNRPIISRTYGTLWAAFVEWQDGLRAVDGWA